MNRTTDAMARLATELRQLRIAAGLAGIEAGRRTGISQSKISKIENRVLRPSPEDVRALCRAYAASPGQEARLVKLAESLRTEAVEPRRVTLSRGALNMQQRIRRIEESATLLRSFQPCMVIGLLQTDPHSFLARRPGWMPTLTSAAAAFRMAATSLWRSKTYLGAKFKRLRTHLGAPKAITAMAHNLARLVYRMLKYGQEYVDKGMDFYQQRYQQQQIKWLQNKAKDLGLVISVAPATVTS